MVAMREGAVGSAGFCTKCGARLKNDAVFCTKCGAPSRARASDAAPGVSAGITQGASAAVAALAGAAGVGVALPWHTITGPGPIDGRALLATLGLPALQGIARTSLRRPGIAMAVTTALDVLVATITGGMPGLVSAIPRLVLGSATSVLSLVTGGRTGALRSVTGAVAAVTAVVQLGFAAQRLVAMIGSGATWLALLPGAVAMLSTLVMAVKTAIVAFRGAR